MARPVIAVDIDDVLSSQIEVFIEFSNKNFGLNLSEKDFQTPGEYWGYYRMIWGVSEEEAKDRYRKFLDEKYPLKQIVQKDVQLAISQLKKNFEIDVITSRHAEMSDATLEWLIEHFPETFRGVHFVSLWGGSSQSVTKAEICREVGAGYLVDDNAEHCNLAAEVGVKSLLFGKFGWNTYQDLHPSILRVANWHEVLEFFDGEAKQ